MPRRKAPPRRNEGVGVEAASTPPARKKSRSGTRHPPLAEPVEVAIRERRPEDVVVASLEGVAVGAPETDDVPLGSAGARALVRPASRDHASFEWARMCRPATISTETRAEKNDDDDDAPRVEAPPRAGWRRYAFPAETLALGHADTTGETLLECFLALLREGTLGLTRAASGLGDEHHLEEKQKTATSRLAEKNARLRVCLTADAFADAPAFAEHASRKKKHARLRRVLAHWLCPPTDAVERFAAGVATSAGETIATAVVSRDAAARAAYAAAKPPREAPAFAGAFPGLLPDPRPYQRRAVHWMVRREKGGADAASKAPGATSAFVSEETKRNASLHPLWSPLRSLRVLAEERSAGASCFVNWHTGQVSRVAFPAPPDVKGGILADEMGLGKTVELLMCVLAHRYEGPGPRDDADAERKPNEKTDLDESHEIVGCACGVDGVDYDGLWLCCESCLEWSHARCVGYTAADEKKHAARVAEAAEAEARAEAAETEARAAHENQRAAHTTEPPSDDETRRGDFAKAERGEAAVRLVTSPDPLAKNEEEDAGAEKQEEEEEEEEERVHLPTSSVLLDALRAAERATRLTRLARERAEDAPFTCGRCVARRAGCHVSGPCGATLVVCPSAILAQWRSELKRHAAPGALNVITYEGQPRGASGPDAKTRAMNTRTAPVSALDLARADVVLTTYETLRGDLHHAPDAAASDGDGPGGTGGRASRHRKKYEIIPTPLTRLTWWRVVLDEAQEVESSTAAAAAMACLVPGVHRWAVTGTPVSRGVEDLQGLFAFLRAPSPLTDRHWFRRVVEAPFEKGHAPSIERALFDVLRRVMWRNARADVADELRLPPQGQTVTSLRPSGIEAHWYRKQREVCERAAREALRRVVDPARARAEAAADLRINREGGPIAESRNRGRDAAAFAPGAGRRLGGRPDDDRDDGTGDAFAIDDLIDDDEDDAVSSGDSPRRDGGEDDAATVDLTANDDAANAVDRRLTAEESRRVLVPLLRLRQACNHPQAGTHGVRGLVKGGAARADGILAGAHIGAGGIHSGAIMSMPQIHAVLIEKQRVEAEEAQRLVAFTRNASAGVACCEARFGAAVEHYRQVLKLEASGAADGLGLRLDPLQRLHALHNLRLALDAADEAAAKKTSSVAVSRALRDDTLNRDAETERQKYLASRAGGVGAASEHMRRASAAVASALARCGAAARGPGPAGATWWAEALSLARRDARDPSGSGLFDRLVDGALQGSWQGERVAFTDLNGFRFALERDLEKLTTLRAAFLEDSARLEKITADAKPEDVDAAGRCGACVLGGGEKRNFFFEDSRRHDAAFTSGTRGREALVTCHHCLAQPRLAAYEDAVFGRQASDEHVRGGARGRVARADVGAGRSAPSSAETALRFLLAKCCSRNGSLFEAGSAHVESLELMRREFRNACVLQKHQRDELHARDELAMATTRIRTRRDDEVALGGLPDPVPERLRASVVHAWELPEMEAQYAADRAAHEADLRRAASQVRFLERLRREDEQARVLAATSEFETSANAPANVARTSRAFECPVCQEDADGSTAAAELAVLPCGHKLCVSCTDALVSRAPPPPNSRHPKSFKCPTCRERTPADEINYVSSGGARASVERFFLVKAPSDDAGDAPDAPDAPRTRWDMDASLGTEQEQLAFEASVVVKGSWGTKIEAVTRRALWLLDANRNGADSATKILVFSEWEDALRVVAAALRANGVAVAHPGGGGKKLRDAVEAFAAKRNENETGSAADLDARVLLMPLRRGANGLNLTSAQHVILLEPVMDPGAEAQAMKRVDRIGQTKPTFVHRFTLLNTVEENVQALSRRRRECAPGDDDAGGARGAGLRVSEARLLIEGTSATKTERA